MKKKPFVALILILALSLYLFSGKKERPLSDVRLVLLIVVDQFPQSHFDRFRHLFQGGLKLLLEKGVVFDQSFFQHADTATCPGHASLLTGTHPSRSGIIANHWFDRRTNKDMYCVADDRYKRSPRNLLTSTLGDWLKREYSDARVFSASAKDRAAIMMGGKRADAAYWYDKKTGDFISSKYYSANSPDWLKSFNAQRRLLQHFGSPWNPLPVDDAQRRTAQIVELDEGVFPNRFPHRLGSTRMLPDKSFYGAIYSSPFVDQHLAEFARHLISSEELGTRETTDMLALSFSAADSVGHGYGPNSRETLDTVLRLDRELGILLSFIDKRIGLEHVLIAFSSDHGVQPLPEYQHSLGNKAYRQQASDVACVQNVGNKVAAHYGTTEIFASDLYLDERALRKHKISRRDVEQRVQSWLEECPLIEKIWLPRDFQNNKQASASYFELFKKGFYKKRSADFIPQLKHNHLHSLGRGTGHGSPYAYDTHVPLVLVHNSLSAAKISEKVAPVDLAPTIASLLALPTPERLDGKDLTPLLEKKAAHTEKQKEQE